MKKIIPHILFVAVLILSISCESKKDIPSKFYSSKKNLKIILTDPVETLDPLKILYSSDWRVASNIFEGLMTFDMNDNVKNGLVDSVTISEDNLEYSFFIKENVYFHDSPCFENGKGRKLNSSDIKFTFERLAAKENNFPNWQLLNNKIEGISKYYRGEIDSISGLKIINKNKILIKLNKPYGSFLKILATPGFYIVPKEAINYYGERFASNPVGTGPFRISVNIKYEKITLVKNEKYHLFDKENIRLPYINYIEYRTIGNTENIISELIKGNSDFINTNYTNYSEITSNELIHGSYKTQEIDKGLGLRFWGFYFNLRNNSIEYKNLRKIISQKFYSKFDQNSLKPNKTAISLVPEHLLDRDVNYLKIHKRAARVSRFELNDTLTILANMEYPDLLIIENILDELSLPYKRIIKPDNYYQMISQYKPFLFRVSMTPSFPDPIEYYSLFYSKNSSYVNLGQFKNSNFDKIYESVQTEAEPTKRNIEFEKLERILQEKNAAIYLTHEGPLYYIYSNNLKNLKFSYIIPDFRELYFE